MVAYRPRRVLLLACLLLTPAAARAQLSAEERLARRDELAGADRAAGDSVVTTGLAGILARIGGSDLVLVYPGASVIAGLDHARQLVASQESLKGITLRWVPLYTEVSADGSFGLTYGVTAIASAAPPPAGPLRLGKYLSAWRRGADGWKLVAHAQVGLLPPAAYQAPADYRVPSIPALPRSGPAADFARADADFATQAGKEGAPAAFATWVADDGVAFPSSGELARGPAAMRRWLGQGPQSAWSWRPVAGGGVADLGFTVGEATITAPGEPPSYGKYLTLWRREADGKIRFVSDGGNARPAPLGQ